MPEDCLSLHYLSSLPLSPTLFLFCLSLIKKPNHADSSEQITSHSPWMFEDDGATGATREEIHSDRSRSSSRHDISTHKFAPVLFGYCCFCCHPWITMWSYLYCNSGYGLSFKYVVDIPKILHISNCVKW